jgi:HlyD family secretion protein
VERAQADLLQAQLDREIARLAIQEFQDGTMRETLEGLQGRITLARSELERAVDRRNWSRRMKEKGYIAASVLSSDEFRVEQAELIVQQEETAFDLFKRYTAPKATRELEGALQGTEAILSYQTLRFQRHEDRLRKLEKQVELCTIRAPHDGFVVYANDGRRNLLIEEGMPVRQWQKLFYLPDLNDMEVVTLLHESVVDEIRPGMRAAVDVESLPNREISGRVTAIAPLSISDWRSDVSYFQGTVKLENTPVGLRPGMTA